MNKLPYLTRPLLSVALLLHAFGAAGWWWMMPGGFGLGSHRFWVNQMLPFFIAGIAAAGVWGIARGPTLPAGVAIGFGVMWLVAGVMSLVAMPVTMQLFFVLPVLIGLGGIVLGGLHAWATREPDEKPRRRAMPIAFAGAMLVAGLVGAWLPFTQLGPPPSTLALIAPPTLDLPPADRTLLMPASGRYMAQLEPMLTFISRSPDRSWSLLAPTDLRREPWRQDGDAPGEWIDVADTTKANDVTVARHRLAVETVGNVTKIDGYAELSETIYTHLNSYTLLLLSGHKTLSVAFSPTGDTRFEVTPSDYPAGRPSRLACLMPGDRFVVLEASSAEKGPFKELAAGTLRRGEPVTITFFDGDTKIARWTLHDFAAHASVLPSPTAGYGLPQNAIRFNLEGDTAAAPAAVYVTLAGTGVGRGYDTVGHATGFYRTRHTWAWSDAGPSAN